MRKLYTLLLLPLLWIALTGLELQPLPVNIQNDADTGLELQPLPVNIQNNADTGLELQPLTVNIQNDTDVDIAMSTIFDRNLDQDKVDRIEDRVLYAHTTRTFSINRTGYPASLFIGFRIALTQGLNSGLKIARWEYEERSGSDASCHIESAADPFTIGCTGDNDLSAPTMNINIGHNAPSVVPRPLINGGEPDAGPPSYP